MSKIEWCDITINPFIGCSHCSPGCENCYAERFAVRLSKNKRTAERYAGVVEGKQWSGTVRYFPYWYEKLPLKPKKVFLGSMGDIFHPSMKLEWIEEIFKHIEEEGNNVGHIFFLLTKRIERAKDICNRVPLPKNVWLGVTACNQQEVDYKIPILLEIKASRRFVSIEPLLGSVDLNKKELLCATWIKGGLTIGNYLDWVICGGETGPNARPMNPEWARSLRDQCQASEVPFFFKSYGEWFDDVDPFEYMPKPQEHIFRYENKPPVSVYRIGKKKIGRFMDGVQYSQFPKA